MEFSSLVTLQHIAKENFRPGLQVAWYGPMISCMWYQRSNVNIKRYEFFTVLIPWGIYIYTLCFDISQEDTIRRYKLHDLACCFVYKLNNWDSIRKDKDNWSDRLEDFSWTPGI